MIVMKVLMGIKRLDSTCTLNTGKFNTGIKTQRTIKTNLPHQFMLNGLTFMIGQLGLVQLTNMKTERKDVIKPILLTNGLLIRLFTPFLPVFLYQSTKQALIDQS